jgi:4-nitrophenyl phosphatase
MAWICDLDGVVWLGDRPIPGAAEAVARLRRAGERVLFVTNNSAPTVASYLAKLKAAGIEAAADDVVTSAAAAARLVDPAEVALVCAGAGVVEALEARGVRWVREGRADVVVVGWHRDFDYDRMAAATRAVLGGARLVATNDDPTYPAPDGPLPGCGAILASITTATGAVPVVAGKPNEPMAALIRERLGEGLAKSTFVGDRPDTDGRMARALGIRFALVLSGITATAEGADPPPDAVGADLGELVAT